MPHFFLHVQSGEDLVPDEEGFDLPDLAAARWEAIRGARAIMAADVENGRLHLDQEIVIQDAAGNDLDRVRFEDIVTIVRSLAAYRERRSANDA